MGEKPKLELLGRNGNAFAVLGAAHRVARKAGWTSQQWEAVQTEATAGDYDLLLQTMMKYFEVE